LADLCNSVFKLTRALKKEHELELKRRYLRLGAFYAPAEQIHLGRPAGYPQFTKNFHKKIPCGIAHDTQGIFNEILVMLFTNLHF